MRLHAILLPASILATCLIPAAAQSGSSPHPASSFQPCGFAYGTVCGGFAPGRAPAPNYLAQHDSRIAVPGVRLVSPGTTKPSIEARNNQVCFAIRSYNFPTDPAADITKPTSITTCEPPKPNGLKSATSVVVR